MYKIPDRITDALALCGMVWIVCEAWRGLEVWLYGASQESAVDGAFAIIFSVAVIFVLRLWSVFEHEGGDPL